MENAVYSCVCIALQVSVPDDEKECAKLAMSLMNFRTSILGHSHATRDKNVSASHHISVRN